MKRSESIPFEQLSVPGMLYACMVRTSSGIGHIRAIKTPALPAGYSLITADQLPFRNELWIGDISIPLFASKSVSYTGEAVGLIIGPDPLIAEELASISVVECEEPASFVDWHSFSSSHIAARIDFSRGETTEAGQSADTATDTLEFGSYLNIEPHELTFQSGIGAVAEWDYDKLKLACPTLWPEHMRTCIARMLGASVEDIEISMLQMDDSSELYSWYPSLLAARATVAAWVFKRPVKLIVSTKREKKYLPRIHGISLHLKTKWSKDTHRLLHVDCRFAIPIGAYSIFAQLLLEKTAYFAAGSIPETPISITGFAVKTNMVPMGALEDISAAAIYGMIEAHIARAARALDSGPLELSQSTFSKKEPSKNTHRNADRESAAVKLARPLLQRADFYRKYAAYEQIYKRNPGEKEATLRAISFSLAHQNSQILLPSATNRAQIQLMLDRNLRAVLESDAAYSSERLKTALKLQISQNLKIPAGHISFENMQQTHPGAIPLISSSGMAIVGDLVRRASDRIQRMRFREGLPLAIRTYSVLKHEEALKKVSKSPLHPSIGAAILEVEYDTRTAIMQQIRLDISVYAGKILSRAQAASAVRAASFEALRACLIGFYPEHRGYNDIYASILSQSVIHVELMEDEKASIPRPLGDLAYALVLSCFLEVLQQLSDSNRLMLPFRPASTVSVWRDKQ
jgi:CO/xanthine dehydrogenase Mo-binding subunit